MTPEERALKPYEYMLVNYLKSNPKATFQQMSFDLKYISDRSARTHVKTLEKLGVLKVTRGTHNCHGNRYEVNDQSEWIVH